jgi:hypothetical protein
MHQRPARTRAGTLAVAQPVVDGVGGDPEDLAGLLDADLTVLHGHHAGCEDLVDAAHAGDVPGGEAQVLAGAQAGIHEYLRDLRVAVGDAVCPDDRQRLGWGAARSAPVDDELVGGAGVPSHADAHPVRVLFQQQRHVGDQGP